VEVAHIRYWVLLCHERNFTRGALAGPLRPYPAESGVHADIHKFGRSDDCRLFNVSPDCLRPWSAAMANVHVRQLLSATLR
jgi:hypothetical protein